MLAGAQLDSGSSRLNRTDMLTRQSLSAGGGAMASAYRQLPMPLVFHVGRLPTTQPARNLFRVTSCLRARAEKLSTGPQLVYALTAGCC